MKLKIKHRLWIVNAGLGLFFAFIFFLYANLSGSFDHIIKITQDASKQSRQIEEALQLTKKYLNNTISYQNLKEYYKSTSAKNDDFSQIFHSLSGSIDEIENLKQMNTAHQRTVDSLTNFSISQSNGYLTQISAKLADTRLEKDVSILERLVIAGATANTNVNFNIQLLFARLEINKSLENELMILLDKSIENARKDIERLKNTPFARLPENALASNQQIKQQVNSYKNNQNKISALQNDIEAKLNHSIAELNAKTETFLQNRSKSSSSYIINAVFILLTIIAAILVFNIWLGVYIGRQLGGEPAEVAKIAKSIGNGNLNIEFDTSRKAQGVYLEMMHMNSKLKEVMSSIQQSINNLSSTSRDLSGNISSQAASTEEVSSSMEQMLANIEQNASNAIETEKITTKTAAEINSGYQSVLQTVQSMHTIVENISIIEELAEKTDLLAINAAIEAARAGEHGKGFAVVAIEVRKLAERSQAAASQINSISKSSVEIAEKTGKAMSEVVPEIEKTLLLVQEITTSSKEQSSGVNQVNTAVQQLNESHQINAANAQEMSNEALLLQKAVEYFNLNHEELKTNSYRKPQTKFETRKIPSKVKISSETYSL